MTVLLLNVAGGMLPCGALELVLQYVGQRVWLCMGLVSKEWQSAYTTLYGAKETSCKHMKFAVKHDRLSMLQYLFESRCPVYKHCCLDAVHFGHVNILKFLLKHPSGAFVLHDNMCGWATFSSKLNMLRFLHEQGLALNGVRIYGNERVEVVQYLRQHGWEDKLLHLERESLPERAARRGNVELLRWAHEDELACT
jgi:hypothetical protein